MDDEKDDVFYDEEWFDVDCGSTVEEPSATYSISGRTAKAGLLVEKNPPSVSQSAVENWLNRPFRYSRSERGWDYYQQIGREGEAKVIEFEKEKLRNANRPDLAESVKTSDEKNGNVFDIYSFDENGREIFIEVKTTELGSSHPFILTEKQIAASEKFKDRYRLYRVYQVRGAAEFFVLKGPLSVNSQTVVKALWGWPNGSQ